MLAVRGEAAATRGEPAITDVQERQDRQGLSGLRDGEARLRSLADALPHGMAYQVHVSADRKSRRFTFVSDNCPRLNGGVSVDEALADAEKLYGLVAPEFRRVLHEAETKALETLEPFDIEAQFVLPSGERRWCRLTSSPRAIQDGSTIWEGFQVDITARRQAEQALRDSQSRLALAMDATGLGLWEYDLAGGELTWNERTKAFYGLAPDAEVDFEAFVEAIHPDDRDLVLGGYNEALERPGGGDFSFEHRVVQPGGAIRWLLAHGRVVADADGKAARVLGTSLDITERKRAEERQQLLLDELNHRVKNSFTTVASLLQLRAKRAASAETREQLGDAVNQVMSIAQAYTHLYAGGQPRSLDFADYLRALCEGLAQGMTDGERVRLNVAAVSAVMETDRALPLGMAVNELVTNAIKYAFPEGRGGCIDVTFELADGGWRLTICDDGVGLPADFGLDRGTGAGLVKAFAQQARASLQVQPGPGARFVIASAP